MVQLVILPMVQLVVNGTIGLPLAYRLHHWLTNGNTGLPMVPLEEPMVPLALPLVPMVLPMVPSVEP